MKAILIALAGLVISLSAHAQKTELVKTGHNSASLKIMTGDEPGQAAEFVDASDNEAFINLMLQDSASELAQLKDKVEKENCDEESLKERNGDWIPMCGQVVITDAVRTEFGRGGWAGAGASYTFFVGFMSAGTGRITEMDYAVTISEGVNAINKDDGDFTGVYEKSMVLVKIQPFSVN